MIKIIRKKRDGGTLTKGDITTFIEGLVSGDIPDYQVSAFLMATFFQGMSDEETARLTEAMMHSGDVLDLTLPALELVQEDLNVLGGAAFAGVCLSMVPVIWGLRKKPGLILT